MNFRTTSVEMLAEKFPGTVNVLKFRTFFSLINLISNTILVFRAGIYEMLVRIVSREDPDQTASSEAV